VCRFRFMFLEEDSEFSYRNMLVMPVERVPEVVSRLQKELNLLRKDSRDAGLDEPHIWRQFVSWDQIEKMAAAYRPNEIQLRATIARILEAKGQEDKILPLRQEIADVLKSLTVAIRPGNSLLLQEMAKALQELATKVDK